MSELIQTADKVLNQSVEQFPLPIDDLVSELLQAKSYPEVCYYMGKLMGAKHFINIDQLPSDTIEALRQSMLPLWKESHLWQWALEKPYGYAGDFVALELLYDNQAHATSSPVGKLLDRWLLDSQLGFGVRERKNILSAFIQKFTLARFQALSQKTKVLSVAAGSARELRDLSESTLNTTEITLVDLDERSLEYAASHLPEGVRTLRANALRLKPSTLGETYSLIYSFGFFDYLKDAVIIRCLKLFQENLEPGGSIVFPLKIDSKFRHWFYDLVLDWRFVKREINDGFALANAAGLEVVELIETENESVVFFHCVALK